MPANVVSAWGNSKLMKLCLPDIAGIGAGMPITKAICIDGLMLLQKVEVHFFTGHCSPFTVFSVFSIAFLFKVSVKTA